MPSALGWSHSVWRVARAGTFGADAAGRVVGVAEVVVAPVVAVAQRDADHAVRGAVGSAGADQIVVSDSSAIAQVIDEVVSYFFCYFTFLLYINANGY